MFILWFSGILIAGSSPAEVLLKKAQTAIVRGQLSEARRCLDRLQAYRLTSTQQSAITLLEAEILQDMGLIKESMDKLKIFIGGGRQRNIPVPQLADAYIAYARNCRSLIWLELFNSALDSLGTLVRQHGLSDPYRMAFHTNKALYHLIQIQSDRAKPYMDSMVSILDHAPSAERHRYMPERVFAVLLTAHRNERINHFDAKIDSVMQTIHAPLTTTDPYGSIMLWRALGNYWMDRTNPEDPKVNRRAEGFAQASFDKALQILDRHYPQNDIERISLMNLKGLCNYRAGSYAASLVWYQKSEDILDKAQYPVSFYTYQHEFTALWQYWCMEKFLKGKALTKKRWQQLRRWQEIGRYWEKWKQINRNDSLLHYQGEYTWEPDAMTAMLLHGLYTDTNDASLLDSAFVAMEHSRYTELREKMIRQRKTTLPEIPSLRVIRESLSREEAIISFIDAGISEIRTLAMVISRDTIGFILIDDTYSLKRDIRNFTTEEFVSNDLGSVKQHFHNVYNFIFKDIEKFLALNVRKLTIHPSGFIMSLNFDLLIPDTNGVRSFSDIRYLKDRFVIRYDQSWMISKIRQKEVQQVPQTTKRVNLVFNPDYSGTPHYRLPFMDRLSMTLQERHGFSRAKKGEATVAAYRLGAGTADVIHFSGHAFSNMALWADQYIVLDSVDLWDKPELRPFDIIRSETQARMVVLSICNGGLAKLESGPLKNLVYWFTYAGAQSCVYAYWKMDDRSTAMILERFYIHLSEGMVKSDALSAAKDDYLLSVKTDEERNPLYWGSLMVIGDDRPIQIPVRKTSHKMIWAFMLAGVIVMATGIWIYQKRGRFHSTR
jgi:CHAT domain-containing protein